MTRTRGAAIDDAGTSLHLTDPTPEQIPAAAGIDLAYEFERAWVDALEERLVEAARAEVGNRPSLRWSMRIVGFHQNIWVTDPHGSIATDTRRGQRLEFRVADERYSNAVGVAEHVLDASGSPPPSGFFWTAFDRAERRRHARSAPAGACAAVFGPGAGGILIHELVGHALEGDGVLARPSWIQDSRLPPAACAFSVIDEPRRGRGSWRVDDEGVPSGRTLLIEGGRVAGVLLDRTSGRARGVESNGHGRRASYLEPVRPRMGCTFLAPGTDDPAGIVTETQSGIYVRRVNAGHTDPIKGRATFVVTDADLIESGCTEVPLDPFVMDVRGLDLWQTMDRVGSDLTFDACIGSCVRDGQPLAVSVGAPTIRIGVITVNC